MEGSFLVPVILFVACLGIRCAYELLKESGRIDPENKAVFALVFASMVTLWISWFLLCPADPFSVELPGPIRWIGLVVFAGGTLLAVGALIQLRGVENIDHLVSTGLFKRIRHPMYLGFISWIVGWSIYHGAVAAMAVGLPGIACILWWRRLEEGRLRTQFGSRYTEYAAETWF